MKNSSALIYRALVAVIAGTACAFFYVSAAFVTLQPEGALRALWLVTLFDYKAFIVFVSSLVVSAYYIKKPNGKIFLAAIIALFASIACWSYAGDAPLSEWLLPPVRGK